MNRNLRYYGNLLIGSDVPWKLLIGKGKMFPLQARWWPRVWVEI